jgi:hypothetical protein
MIRLGRPMIRSAACGVVTFAVLAASGCGGGNGNNAEKKAARSGPDTANVVLTVLNFGRAASAKEACPLLSKGYVDRLTNGMPSKCATAAASKVCPCQSVSLATNSVTLNGDKADVIAMDPNGKTLNLKLVRQGAHWKIDAITRT